MRKLLGAAIMFFGVAMYVQGADIDDLAKKLKDKDNDNRRAAAQALAEAGVEAKAAIPALTAALKDSDLFVRRFAAQALGEIGADAKGAVTNLSNILKDPKEKKEVQEAAALALGKIGSAGLPALTAAIKNHDADAAVRRSAILGVAKQGTDARTALPALLDVVKEKDGTGKKGPPSSTSLKIDTVNAIGAIATAKDDDAIKTLEGMIDKKTKDKALVSAVREAVKKIKGRS
jgi:HEAT repeat protein